MTTDRATATDAARPGTGDSAAHPSARRAELLELAYQYAVSRGQAELSLRPLARAVGSSPRVLLYLFDSKDGLIRALLARARADELALLAGARDSSQGGLTGLAERTWSWLADDRHRGLLKLWVDGYARSLAEPDGPWAGFAAATVADWLAVLAAAQPATRRDTPAGEAERTLVLAVLRGGLLDLLATGDTSRVTAAVQQQLALLPPGRP
ncbi:MAG TPA: TetR/AcrR family transcriptional regulator [Streptosporangiaceae bacterium]|jgi:AcrR family transcriptional regulator